MSGACRLDHLLERILRSKEFSILPEVQEVASQYKYKARHFRYLTPVDSFPITEEISKELPEVVEIHPILQTTTPCAGDSLPSDGSCLNLIIEEPLPFDQVPGDSDITEELRSREVILYLLQYDAHVYPLLGGKPVASGYLGNRTHTIWCKLVDEDEVETFETLQQLGSGSHHIATFLFPPFQLPNGQYLITMPHYGDSHSHSPATRGSPISSLFRLDIKPQNITLADDSSELTVIDLGWTMECARGHGLTYAAGTPGWVAPQVQQWHDYYDEDNDGTDDDDDEEPLPYLPRKVDIWAVWRLILYLIDKHGAEPDEPRRLRQYGEWLMNQEEKLRPNVGQALEVFNKMFFLH
ncbi:hypothetical protein V5O48_007836 [Marasmius crinis-equi]|uniref:Protein kinase domain-containing protein n=1 Tax=Marasmius crinis-equi TaxID=585013 RepID=A0ABR3FFK1_9AGAR